MPPKTKTPNPLEARLAATNIGFFLREFSISELEYTPEGGSEVEFADHVVLIGDILFVVQAKRRESPDADQTRDRSWHRKVVAGDAVRQIRQTLARIATAPAFPNEHGEPTTIPRDLAGLRVYKLVIYDIGASLPASARGQKHQDDREAGFVHIFHVDDYELVLKTLVTVPELVEYLDHREATVRRYPEATKIGRASCRERV